MEVYSLITNDRGLERFLGDENALKLLERFGKASEIVQKVKKEGSNMDDDEKEELYRPIRDIKDGLKESADSFSPSLSYSIFEGDLLDYQCVKLILAMIQTMKDQLVWCEGVLADRIKYK